LTGPFTSSQKVRNSVFLGRIYSTGQEEEDFLFNTDEGIDTLDRQIPVYVSP